MVGSAAWLRTATLLLAGVGHVVSAAGPLFVGDAAVAELEPEAINKTVVGRKNAYFVDFYADWCPHCIHFAPVWKSVAASFSGDTRVKFAALDCARYTQYCIGLGVEAYPTMRAYNIPGVVDSFKEGGTDFHEGEYSMQQEGRLVQKINAKIAQLGPRPATPAGPGEVVTVAAPSPAAAAPAPAPLDPDASAATAALRLIDGEVALLYALRQGVFLKAAMANDGSGGDGVPRLSGVPLEELVSWLGFLSQVFPSKSTREHLVQLKEVATASLGSGLAHAAWLRALDARRPGGSVPAEAGKDPTPYWRLCDSYTCGLWTLFHIATTASAREAATAAAARAAGGVGLAPVPSGMEALARIRGFVANFFGCANCVKHFLDTYDTCQFGRCNLDPQSQIDAALWMWQVHNNVTARVNLHNHRAAVPPWPTSNHCPGCWKGTPGGLPWNPSAVYGYLSKAYVPPQECSVADGSTSSAVYPCSCGSGTVCSAGQWCTANMSRCMGPHARTAVAGTCGCKTISMSLAGCPCSKIKDMDDCRALQWCAWTPTASSSELFAGDQSVEDERPPSVVAPLILLAGVSIAVVAVGVLAFGRGTRRVSHQSHGGAETDSQSDGDGFLPLADFGEPAP